MLDPRKIWSSSQLPSLPAVAVKLLELSKNPETEIADVVNVIKSDPAISAKILKATNSTFFGFSSRVTSIDRAVPLLGTTVVTSLALSFSLADNSMNHGAIAEFYSAYWMQSIVQAAAAETVGSVCAEGLGCEFFLAGLLLDIGRLAMLKTIPDLYLPVLKCATAEQRSLYQAEEEALGVNHAQVSFELMRNWKLPESLGHAAKLHHSSVEAIQAESACADYTLLKALAVAGTIGDYFCETNKGGALERLRTLTTAFYGFTEPQLEDLLARAKVRIDATGDLFSVNVTELGDPSDLMAQANEQLVHLAMREHAASTQALARQKEVEQEKRELETKNEELQQQALNDPLTKIYNRRFFDETLGKEVQRCSRYATSLGVVFIDVDHFKKLNDSYGHQFGDTVLKRVAAMIGEVLRSSDTLARYGGEEFVVLINQPTEKGLEKLAERIRSRIETEQINFGEQRVPVTVSIGATLALPSRNEAKSGPQIVEVADQAMYEAKQAGRNRVRVKMMISEADRQLVNSVTQRRFSRWLVGKNVLDISTVSQALLQCKPERLRIGDWAKKMEMLDDNQIKTIMSEQDSTGERFGEIALRMGLLNQPQLVELLACQLEDPRILAAILIKLGLVEAKRCLSLLQEYRAECPARLPALTFA